MCPSVRFFQFHNGAIMFRCLCPRSSLVCKLDKAYVKTYATEMIERHTTVLTASEARANLYRLIDQAAESHEPISISGKRANAVLIAESDWNAMQETLYLLSIPGMRKSIRQSLKTPLSKCSPKLNW